MINYLTLIAIGAIVAIVSPCLLIQNASVVVNWKKWLEKWKKLVLHA